MFSILSRADLIFSVIFIVSSADAFNFNQSRILSFGYEIRIIVQSIQRFYQTAETETVLKKCAYKNHFIAHMFNPYLK